jgi:hypothetical protein
MERINFVGIQMEALLREETRTTGELCGQVVDLAVEVASYVVLASFIAAKQIGLQSLTLLHRDLIL